MGGISLGHALIRILEIRRLKTWIRKHGTVLLGVPNGPNQKKGFGVAFGSLDVPK